MASLFRSTVYDTYHSVDPLHVQVNAARLFDIAFHPISCLFWLLLSCPRLVSALKPFLIGHAGFGDLVALAIWSGFLLVAGWRVMAAVARWWLPVKRWKTWKEEVVIITGGTCVDSSLGNNIFMGQYILYRIVPYTHRWLVVWLTFTTQTCCTIVIIYTLIIVVC
jgi:hypothetical protein